jgi:hypothetical protein
LKPEVSSLDRSIQDRDDIYIYIYIYAIPCNFAVTEGSQPEQQHSCGIQW